ncbi:hypothetical protein MG293_013202 [Ovis ammon polii]|uniref:Catsper channel auxiliary subunit epsilon n=1 Tax=Ovis ammon polii TaxID=230172 RepID=A0AAD4U2Y8_OVIAM|nr:hypothetical protein MG293_013202 [Ovis ammon polii]
MMWYYSNSPNYNVFSTRSTIKLEYEGTLFSEWSVPAACSIKNKRLPKTELRCSSPGIYAIKPIVSGPDLEEERYLYVDRSHICFLWYYKAMKWYISVPMTENDALKEDKERRSYMAIWTENEVYLGYAFLKFVKILTTEKLKGRLKMSPTATLTVHNVEYTGHPLELALLLNYCIICNTSKTIYLVIYNEDTIQWVFQDFALDVTIDTFLIPYFLYSAMPELLLWDKHRIYYYYHNFRDTGVIQTTTEFGNLSRLSQNSIIHNVLMDYYGNIVVKMENNVMFYFKIKIKDAIKLHLWTNSTVKSLMSFKPSGHVYLIYVFENGKIYAEEYPLKLEAQSITFKTKEKCPYVAFHNDIFSFFYFLDKGQNLSLWAQIVYSENIGLYIVVESYGPKILEIKDQVQYEVTSRYYSKTTTLTFSQNINYETVDDYFKLQYENTGILLVEVRPSELAKTCAVSHKVFQISVGCDASKFIAVKGQRVKYNWDKYGCPLKVNIREKFHPLVQLYNDNGYVEDVEVNFIVWETHGRDDYSFNNTMKKNYKHCFSYAIGKPGDLTQPYEIINKSNHNHLVWPLDHSGIYVFRVKILDPNYSFCNLTTIFAIETFGVIPRPNGYMVAAFVFLLMLLFLTILILSYFHYMRIYRKYIYEPLHESERKKKKN